MNLEIANRLVGLRKENKLSQEALAEKLGYHRGDPYPVYWIGREN